jgi:hypothetical protein
MQNFCPASHLDIMFTSSILEYGMALSINPRGVLDRISFSASTRWWLSQRRRYLEFMILLTIVRVWFKRQSCISPSLINLNLGPELLIRMVGLPCPFNMLLLLVEEGEDGGEPDSEELVGDEGGEEVLVCPACSPSAAVAILIRRGFRPRKAAFPSAGRPSWPPLRQAEKRTS